MIIPERNEIKQKVKDWLDKNKKFQTGQLASFVADLFGELYPPVENIIRDIPDYLYISNSLQELSELLLKKKGIKRTEKAEKLWQSMKSEESAIYCAFLSQVISPFIYRKAGEIKSINIEISKPFGYVWEYAGDIHFQKERPNFGPEYEHLIRPVYLNHANIGIY